MELIERSVRSPDYHAGKEAAESLGSRIKNTIQESFKKDPALNAGGERSNGPAAQNPKPAENPVTTSPSPVSPNLRAPLSKYGGVASRDLADLNFFPFCRSLPR